VLATRRADVSDLPELVRLFSGYLEFYGKPVDAAVILDFLRERIERGQSVVFLAEADGRAVGFTQLYPAFASLAQKPSWILNDLFVEPPARGQGAATALMQAARGLAAETGACEVFLQTARTNATAQRLYETLGYVRDDEFLVYTLSLPNA
jgi:GNAT superfamily N-acetyltransferase